MVTETEDKNNRDYASNYARGRSGDGVRDFLERQTSDHDTMEYKAYLAGQEDRDKYGYKDQDDCGTGESSEPVVSDSSDSCCYITSACLDDLGIPRTSLEMKAMKTLAKAFILKSFGGKRDYITYGRIAPKIVEAIRSKPDARETWNNVYESIREVTNSVTEGNYQKGYDQYKSLVFGLEAQFVR